MNALFMSDLKEKKEGKMVNNVNAVFYATIYHPIQAGSIDGTDITPHDNGVYRALLGSATGLYDPLGDPKAEGDPYCSLFVGRLSARTDEKSLHEAMSNFGRVKNLRLVRHIVTGASCGYAFVEFETDRDMRFAYENAHGLQLDGTRLLVDYNRQQLMPGWIPRRLGGGLGGKKESGQLRFGGRDRPFRASLRPIPEEELKKLGIPLPPEGRFMSRFQVPPPPQRKHSSEYDAKSEMKHHREEDDSKRRTPSEAPGEERERERERDRSHAKRRTPSEAPPGEERKRDGSHRSTRRDEETESHRSYNHRKHESSRYDGYEFEPKRPASRDAADTHHSERKWRKEHSYEDEGRTRHGRWQPQDDPDPPPPDDHYRHRESKHHRPVSRESDRHGESKYRRRDEDEAHRSCRTDKQHHREEKLDIEQKEKKRSRHRERERDQE